LTKEKKFGSRLTKGAHWRRRSDNKIEFMLGEESERRERWLERWVEKKKRRRMKSGNESRK